ncbi:hypothetical protein CCHR01_15121 [Colletotrichum chrysophilum]|uniref:Uncharacterized protein n=1 Tax=Colletotrichum chrysophilum TaxID=1836956 RepID=A0AAD9A675_9PEZI|nr:hypothetical protein CCHR01_15121 [Colletotrichum chrysophilum]
MASTPTTRRTSTPSLSTPSSISSRSTTSPTSVLLATASAQRFVHVKPHQCATAQSGLANVFLHSTLFATTRTASRLASSPTPASLTRTSSPPSTAPSPSPPPRPTASSLPLCATSPRRSCRRLACPTRSTCTPALSTDSPSAAMSARRFRSTQRSRPSTRPLPGSTSTFCDSMEEREETPSCE